MELEQMLKNVGWEIADRGFDEVKVQEIVAIANRFQVAGVATEVLADPEAPYAPRCRAFDRVVAGILSAARARPAFTVAA